MFYRKFQGKDLSLLGFGAMRLPLLPDGSIDEEQVFQMVDYAASHGVNYYDTAYPYHNGLSEVVLGKALKRYPRESFYLATKYPGHQIAESYNPAEIFEEQLQKCGVEYFDFYLLHNICENSINTYLDPKWGIVDYFLEQKKLGRIHHLGFSTHARVDTLKVFLDKYGKDMEFCQIQLNYLDWTLQDAKGKYELLTSMNIPVWVMESVRGGKLADLGDKNAVLKAQEPDRSIASWSLRWLQRLPNVHMILSGMSSLDQTVDNIATFEHEDPLSDEQSALVLDLAEGLKDNLPCTACRYCCKGCPMGLDIPFLISLYNESRYSPSFMIGMTIDSLSEDKRPSACIGCGKCSQICPQNIDVPKAMQDFNVVLEKMPHWADMCREREEAAKKLRQK